MKVLICVILWISYSYSQKLSWSEYKTKFNKMYSPTEDNLRQQFFLNQKITVIDPHKDRFASGLENFELDYNDLTDIGFAYSYYTGFPWIFWGNFPKGTPIEKPGTNVSFPESFELETSKVVILDQTNHGNTMTCNYGWAFAVAKAVEIFGINNSNQRKNSAPLSPQQLIDCWNGDNCSAGIPHKALQYLADQKQPLFPESSYRYTGRKGDFCSIDLSGYVSSGTIREFSVLEDNATQDQIKNVLVNRKSPVIFEIDPYSERFLNYKTGVYQGNTQNTRSHFMSIVGFGVEIVKGKPVEYWKVINSFGTTWGENGFMKLSRSHPIKKFVFPSKY